MSSTSFGPLHIQELEINIINQHEEYLKCYEEHKKSEPLRLMKAYITQYLNLVQHSEKFKFPSTARVLQQSVLKFGPNFEPRDASQAFENLAKYAQNLIEEPWREEYKTLRLTSGFYVHNISACLYNAHEVLISMGYVNVSDTVLKFSPGLTQAVEFDILKQVSRDLYVASIECIILSQIYDQVQLEEPVNFCGIDEIFSYRQQFLGDVYTIATSIIYQIRSSRQKHIEAVAAEKAFNSTLNSTPLRNYNNNNNPPSAFAYNSNYASKSYPVQKLIPLSQSKVTQEDLLRRITSTGSSGTANRYRELIEDDMPDNDNDTSSWLDDLTTSTSTTTRNVIVDTKSRSRKPVNYNTYEPQLNGSRSRSKSLGISVNSNNNKSQLPEQSADDLIAEAMEYNSRVTSFDQSKPKPQYSNASTSTTTTNHKNYDRSSNNKQQKMTSTSGSKCNNIEFTKHPGETTYAKITSGSSRSSTSAAGVNNNINTNSYKKTLNDKSTRPVLETDLDSLDVVYYQTLIDRSKVPGYEDDVKRVPVGFYKDDNGTSTTNITGTIEDQQQGNNYNTFSRDRDTTDLCFPPPKSISQNQKIPQKLYKSQQQKQQPVENEIPSSSSKPSHGYERLNESIDDSIEEWSCPHCTFINVTSSNICQICSKTNAPALE